MSYNMRRFIFQIEVKAKGIVLSRQGKQMND